MSDMAGPRLLASLRALAARPSLVDAHGAYSYGALAGASAPCHARNSSTVPTPPSPPSCEPYSHAGPRVTREPTASPDSDAADGGGVGMPALAPRTRARDDRHASTRRARLMGLCEPA